MSFIKIKKYSKCLFITFFHNILPPHYEIKIQTNFYIPPHIAQFHVQPAITIIVNFLV